MEKYNIHNIEDYSCEMIDKYNEIINKDKITKKESEIINKIKIMNEQDHKNIVLKKYNNIIDTICKIDHDGSDEYGFLSNLYTFTIYYRKGYNIYIDEWYREDWISYNDIQIYELIKRKI
tara:strand:+ start:293 stop:652 length:360 start_codon:yes stop_codon:yes gene_type:complete